MEYLTVGDLLSDKVEINFHMFGVLMLNRVDGEVHDVGYHIRQECTEKVECGAPITTGTTKWPQPHHWRWCSTRPPR
jgi:hypothetical protein